MPHRKNTQYCETVTLGIPSKIVIPMLQHIGAPCDPVVKKGEKVKVGQVIGQSEKFVSAPIHASVSGVVTDIAQRLYPAGVFVTCVEIKPDGLQEVDEGIKAPEVSDRESFLRAIRNSGLVGLGGAGFPTHVKLSPPPGKKIDTLIVNGAECEPYITSDYRELMENPDGVIEGIKILQAFYSFDQILIGIEDNKPEALRSFTGLAQKMDRVQVCSLKSRYPQGAEKMLIYSTTGRRVPTGKLPSDVGVVVMNVNSVSFIAAYMKTGMPLIKKRVTVDGPAVVSPANVEVLIGTPLKEVFDFCGGFLEPPVKVLMGGPMMGIAQHSLDTSVVKHTNALLAFGEKDAPVQAEGACIRCGRCVRACPMKLQPVNISLHARHQNLEDLAKYHAADCIECGSCSYGCPAGIRLVQAIRLGKAYLRQAESKGGNSGAK